MWLWIVRIYTHHDSGTYFFFSLFLKVEPLSSATLSLSLSTHLVILLSRKKKYSTTFNNEVHRCHRRPRLRRLCCVCSGHHRHLCAYTPDKRLYHWMCHSSRSDCWVQLVSLVANAIDAISNLLINII